MTRINGIQRVNSIRPSSFLLNLESELQKELEIVLNQEEELWALKSHINWMIQRDRNTSFYHISTLVRRKRNQILAIKDLVGEWLHEEADIKDFIRKGFDGIYISSLLSSSRIPPDCTQWQVRLSDEDKAGISGEASA